MFYTCRCFYRWFMYLLYRTAGWRLIFVVVIVVGVVVEFRVLGGEFFLDVIVSPSLFFHCLVLCF